jgi:hypothetical protein
MKYLASFLLALIIAFSPIGAAFLTPTVHASSPDYSGHPTMTITKVVRNTSVTFKAYNLPADDVFRVRMGRMGSRGVGGTIVGSFDTGDGGTQSYTFDIPTRFDGDFQIAIRIESRTGSGYFAYNWFYNDTTGSGSGGSGTGGGYSGFPTIRVLSVVRNSTVTIRVRNLPSDDEFRVLMGNYGTRGINGIRVDSFETGDGGNQTFTFDIPSDLNGHARIAIRIVSKTDSRYFAFNWFFNRTTP